MRRLPARHVTPLYHSECSLCSAGRCTATTVAMSSAYSWLAIGFVNARWLLVNRQRYLVGWWIGRAVADT
jgi:hypothetical protein